MGSVLFDSRTTTASSTCGTHPWSSRFSHISHLAHVICDVCCLCPAQKQNKWQHTCCAPRASCTHLQAGCSESRLWILRLFCSVLFVSCLKMFRAECWASVKKTSGLEWVKDGKYRHAWELTTAFDLTLTSPRLSVDREVFRPRAVQVAGRMMLDMAAPKIL